MRILGIETSSLVAGVAILTDDVITAEYNINHKKTHSQTLMPMIEEILDMTEIRPDMLDAIAVSSGPGSFTGLRIGSASAKGIGLALSIPLIHVPTLEAMAYNLWGTDNYICPIMDARRNQVYTGLYHFEKNGKIITDIEQSAISIDELLEKIESYDKDIVFVGDGIPVFKDTITQIGKSTYRFAPAHMNRQRGAAVAMLGKEYLLDGKTESAAEHVPDYLRLSQAERERREKENA